MNCFLPSQSTKSTLISPPPQGTMFKLMKDELSNLLPWSTVTVLPVKMFRGTVLVLYYYEWRERLL